MHLLIKMAVLLFVNINSLDSGEYYYRKTEYGIEIVKIQKDNFEAYYSFSISPHGVTNYSQGKIVKDKDFFLFNVALIDSIELKIVEKNEPKDEQMFFSSSIKFENPKKDIEALWGFDVDNFNQLGHSGDIRLCIIDSIGNLFYQNYDERIKGFKDITTEYKPALLYLSIGNYIVSKKYFVKNSESNVFQISTIANHLLSNFRRHYLSNHQFRLEKDKLIDLTTHREYIRFMPHDSDQPINEIALEKTK